MLNNHFKKISQRERPYKYTAPTWHENMTKAEEDAYMENVGGPLTLQRQRANMSICTICSNETPFHLLDHKDLEYCNICNKRMDVKNTIEQKVEEARRAINIAQMLANENDFYIIPHDLLSIIGEFAA
jgi:hypothetical protein